jgi:hypothetical protein
MQSNDEFVTQSVIDIKIAQTPLIVIAADTDRKKKTQTEHPYTLFTLLRTF